MGEVSSIKAVSRCRKLYRFLVGVFAIIGVFFVIYHSGFSLSTIYTNSMAPALIGDLDVPRDVVLSERVSYWFRKPRRWEIVKYDSLELDLKTEVMKRVVGLPGESISIKDNWVMIDGEAIERPDELGYLTYYGYDKLYKGKTAECGEGYFVMGDDSSDSFDSRYEGSIEFDRLEGRAWLIIWQWSRIGFVK